MENYVNVLLTLLNEMSPYLLFGFMAAGLLHGFVPRRMLARHLSGNGLSTVLKAVLLGVPLPLCSCGVIPTTVSLRKNGASEAASTSFLIATPQTGIDSIAATYSLLGLPFALLRPVVAMVTGVVGGLLVGSLGSHKEVTDNCADDCGCGSHSADAPKSFAHKLLASLEYGFVTVMQDVGRWLLLGLLIAALITVLVPEGFFAQLADRPLLNMLVVLAIAVPMYVCATGSIPIALSLMLKGLSPGAALVFLMAGPATNVMSLLVMGRVLGKRSMLLYLTTIIAGAVLSGLAIDYLLPAEWFMPGAGVAQSCCHSGCGSQPGWLSVTSSVVFSLLLAWSFIARKIDSLHLLKTQHTDMKKKFKINGMMCNHCKANVERNLATVKGVKTVTVDLALGVAYVEGDFDASEVIEMIKSIGYDYVEE